MNQGTMYFCASFMAFFLKGWHPRRTDFLIVVRVGIVVLMGLIILSTVQSFQMTSLGKYKSLLMDLRLSSSGVNVSANTFAYISSLAIFVLIVLRFNIKANWPFKLCLLFCLGTLLFSKSRAQIAVMLLLLPIIPLIRYQGIGTGIRIFGFLYILFGVFVLFGQPLYEGLFTFFEFEGRSIANLTGRLDTWASCITLLKQNMFWGVNSGEYMVFMNMRGMAAPPHNPFLNVAVYNGIFVGLGFVIAHVYLISVSFARWKKADFGLKMILLTSVSSIMLHQSMDIWYYIYFWFLCWPIIEFKVSSNDQYFQKL